MTVTNGRRELIDMGPCQVVSTRHTVNGVLADHGSNPRTPADPRDTCAECGDAITQPEGAGRRREYCSAYCRLRSYRARRAA
jgi:hypothetical protein